MKSLENALLIDLVDSDQFINVRSVTNVDNCPVDHHLRSEVGTERRLCRVVLDRDNILMFKRSVSDKTGVDDCKTLLPQEGLPRYYAAKEGEF